MQRKKIAVLGGGAAGLMAAITAARNGAQVSMIEHKDRVGRKILMTGNGKCNLTNLHINDDCYYSEQPAKAMKILDQFKPEDTIRLFEAYGLQTKEKKDGGIYPVSEQAASVLDVLREECENLKINMLLSCTVEAIQVSEVITLSGYREIVIENDKKELVKKKDLKVRKESFCQKFDRLILACGGCAAAVSGSDGSGYKIAKELKMKIIQPVPALVQLHGKGDYFKAIAGVRTEAGLTLYIDNKIVGKEYGELQLTDYGISGIPVFQLSRLVSKALLEHKQCKMEIDFYPYKNKTIQWDGFLQKTVLVFLEGYLNKKLALLLLKRAGITPETTVGRISNEMREHICREMHHFMIPILKTNSFEQAQVCAGGISLEEINENMQSIRYPNLYIAGEILDVDGKCGGYNLQWAWATGYIAGMAAAKDNNEVNK